MDHMGANKRKHERGFSRLGSVHCRSHGKLGNHYVCAVCFSNVLGNAALWPPRWGDCMFCVDVRWHRITVHHEVRTNLHDVSVIFNILEYRANLRKCWWSASVYVSITCAWYMYPNAAIWFYPQYVSPMCHSNRHSEHLYSLWSGVTRYWLVPAARENHCFGWVKFTLLNVGGPRFAGLRYNWLRFLQFRPEFDCFFCSFL